MSEFIAGFVPIIVMWLVPIAPMLYAAVAATLETVTKPVLVQARTDLRHLATQSAGDHQAA